MPFSSSCRYSLTCPNSGKLCWICFRWIVLLGLNVADNDFTTGPHWVWNRSWTEWTNTFPKELCLDTSINQNLYHFRFSH
jgi:hypothetical protein